MKLGIDLNQPSTQRGIVGMIFAVASLWFVHKGDLAGAAAVIGAGKFAQGAMGFGIKD